MRNKTLLCVLKVMGFMSVLAFQPSAHALQVTLSIPDCPNGQVLGFSNNVLSCTGSIQTQPVPSNCSITSVPTSTAAAPLTAGTQVTLTASCSTGDQPITYTWNLGVIQPSVVAAPQTTTTYTVTPSNSAGPGASFSTTVYAGNVVTVLPPSNCSISQSPNTAAAPVNAGAVVILTATCSGGSAPTACSWNNGISSTACSVSVFAPSVTTSYNAVASNGGGAAAPASTTVNVDLGGGGGGVAPNLCVNGDNQNTVNWPASGQVRPSTNGFGNQRVSFKITVPQTFSPPLNITHLGFVHISETPGAAVTSRDMTVSKSACDFTPGPNMIYNAIGFGDTAPGANFTVNNPNGFRSAGANFNLQAGDTVYVNVRNANNGQPSCPNSSCDILFDFATPNRY